jgi:hypothetical protein
MTTEFINKSDAGVFQSFTTPMIWAYRRKNTYHLIFLKYILFIPFFFYHFAYMCVQINFIYDCKQACFIIFVSHLKNNLNSVKNTLTFQHLLFMNEINVSRIF